MSSKNYTRREYDDQNEQQIPLDDEQTVIEMYQRSNGAPPPSSTARPNVINGRVANQYVINGQPQSANQYYTINNKSFENGPELKYAPSQPDMVINPNEMPLYVPPYMLDSVRPHRPGRDRDAPSDYLPWSIANIFLCVLFALPALFFSIQTREMKKCGDTKQARSNSKRSLLFNIMASIIGVMTILLAILLRFALYQLFVNNDIQSYNVPLLGPSGVIGSG